MGIIADAPAEIELQVLFVSGVLESPRCRPYLNHIRELQQAGRRIELRFADKLPHPWCFVADGKHLYPAARGYSGKRPDGERVHVGGEGWRG